MGPPISKEVQLVSFHTVSKGYWGECGQRGGYFEMTNIPPKVTSFIIQLFFMLLRYKHGFFIYNLKFENAEINILWRISELNLINFN